ncbi:MAG TPA: hypothetical protein VNN79_08020, partial [Actinomycetota bacterium]|nr:hypothetical protein [Actinomycetota bacterium]
DEELSDYVLGLVEGSGGDTAGLVSTRSASYQAAVEEGAARAGKLPDWLIQRILELPDGPETPA